MRPRTRRSHNNHSNQNNDNCPAQYQKLQSLSSSSSSSYKNASSNKYYIEKQQQHSHDNHSNNTKPGRRALDSTLAAAVTTTTTTRSPAAVARLVFFGLTIVAILTTVSITSWQGSWILHYHQTIPTDEVAILLLRHQQQLQQRQQLQPQQQLQQPQLQQQRLQQQQQQQLQHKKAQRQQADAPPPRPQQQREQLQQLLEQKLTEPQEHEDETEPELPGQRQDKVKQEAHELESTNSDNQSDHAQQQATKNNNEDETKSSATEKNDDSGKPKETTSSRTALSNATNAGSSSRDNTSNNEISSSSSARKKDKDGSQPSSPSPAPLSWYEQQFLQVTEADPSQKTLAFCDLRFYSGLVNQVMPFHALIMYAYDHNFTQVLLPSIRWKDLYGTNGTIEHQFLFDVVHWNTHYAGGADAATLLHLAGPSFHNATTRVVLPEPEQQPALARQAAAVLAPENGRGGDRRRRRPPLPRLVRYHPSMTDMQQAGNALHWKASINKKNTTKPYASTAKQTRLFVMYRRYRKQNPNQRHVSDLAMLQGALRPHPELQTLLEQAKQSMKPVKPSNNGTKTKSGDDANNEVAEATSTGGGGGYLCLHARIEPDMQQHPVCRDVKVTSLQDILDSIYKTYPQAPPPKVNSVLIVLNRKLLEDEHEKRKHNVLAGQNLALLNQLQREGMWNGTVPVYEAGSHLLPSSSTYAKHAPSIAGALLDYQLAVESEIFIGSPVSSFAMQVMATRYSRGRNRNTTQTYGGSGHHPSHGGGGTMNYMYLPKGLQLLPSDMEPPQFAC
ncbi:hypothetical protein ACA910_020075 [Epithemia clementina (nom. ined.)]